MSELRFVLFTAKVLFVVWLIFRGVNCEILACAVWTNKVVASALTDPKGMIVVAGAKNNHE